MKLFQTAFLLAALSASISAWGAGLLEREVIISEEEIQAALTKSGTVQKNYGGLVYVALRNPPRITLNSPDGRAGIAARVDLTFLGNPPVQVDVTGRAGIRYDDRSKAFFLENPVADSLESPALPREAEAPARQAVTQLISGYFRTKPVYVLREDGSPQEIAARWLLKSVRIEAGRIVAILSPL